MYELQPRFAAETLRHDKELVMQVPQLFGGSSIHNFRWVVVQEAGWQDLTMALRYWNIISFLFLIIKMDDLALISKRKRF